LRILLRGFEGCGDEQGFANGPAQRKVRDRKSAPDCRLWRGVAASAAMLNGKQRTFRERALRNLYEIRAEFRKLNLWNGDPQAAEKFSKNVIAWSTGIATIRCIFSQ
jgi:hypothetical protein